MGAAGGWEITPWRLRAALYTAGDRHAAAEQDCRTPGTNSRPERRYRATEHAPGDIPADHPGRHEALRSVLAGLRPILVSNISRLPEAAHNDVPAGPMRRFASSHVGSSAPARPDPRRQRFGCQHARRQVPRDDGPHRRLCLSC
jgi:hypothetical protein